MGRRFYIPCLSTFLAQINFLTYFGVIVRKVDRMLNSLAKRLTSSLRKGDVLHPKIKQSIITMGQKHYVKPVREEKAMWTAIGFLIRYALIGALSINAIYQLKLDSDRYSEFGKQFQFQGKERVEQYEKGVSQQLKENERKINQPNQGFQIFKQAVTGDNASKVVDD